MQLTSSYRMRITEILVINFTYQATIGAIGGTMSTAVIAEVDFLLE